MVARKKSSLPPDTTRLKPDENDDPIFNAAEGRKILSGWRDDLCLATRFLTRIPLGRGEKAGKGAVAASMRAFPLVGAGLGISGGVAFLVAAGLGLSSLPSAILALVAIVVLSGAMHEDALADTVDGFIGGYDRKKRLTIMHDSLIGTYGVLALIFSVGIRVAVLASFAGPGQVTAVLIAALSVSRASLPVIAWNMKPARRSGLAFTVGRPNQDRVYAAVALSSALALLFLGPLVGFLALLAAAISALAVMALARRMIGGYTGDVLGTAQQACEIAVLLVAAAAL
ncbi:MAG: adenosylcobinamide-GDP ribazoletransferase [Alphaproteobacteria bacterium]|jgi:adenosylcobinamide-GDP ribazoletransferase|nr:adenosylcobinamide-GDP ribazoletransferase [Alphaproteobacteria bacterium]